MTQVTYYAVSVEVPGWVESFTFAGRREADEHYERQLTEDLKAEVTLFSFDWGDDDGYPTDTATDIAGNLAHLLDYSGCILRCRRGSYSAENAHD